MELFLAVDCGAGSTMQHAAADVSCQCSLTMLSHVASALRMHILEYVSPLAAFLAAPSRSLRKMDVIDHQEVPGLDRANPDRVFWSPFKL